MSAFSPAACRCYSVPPHPEVSPGTFEGPQTHSRCSTLASAGTFTPVPYPGWVSGGTPRYGVPRNPCSHCFSPLLRSQGGGFVSSLPAAWQASPAAPTLPSRACHLPSQPLVGRFPFPKESRSLQTPPCPQHLTGESESAWIFPHLEKPTRKQPEEAGGLQSGDCKVLTGEGAAACCRRKVLELSFSCDAPGQVSAQPCRLLGGSPEAEIWASVRPDLGFCETDAWTWK